MEYQSKYKNLNFIFNIKSYYKYFETQNSIQGGRKMFPSGGLGWCHGRLPMVRGFGFILNIEYLIWNLFS